MTRPPALAIAAVVLFATAPAMAQVVPPPVQIIPGQTWPTAADQARYQADRHRYEMERLRLEADQREAFARQQALESRLRVMELQAARQPPLSSTALAPLGTPAQERARRDAVVSSTTQIDDWLDRRPH